MDATKIAPTQMVASSVHVRTVMNFRMTTKHVLVSACLSEFFFLCMFLYFFITTAPITVHEMSPVPTLVSILTAAGIILCCLLLAELIAALLYCRKRKKRKPQAVHPPRGNVDVLM